MAANIHIRAFSAADLEAISEIRALAFEPTFRSFRELVGEAVSALAFSQADAEQAEHLASVCAPKSDHHVYVALMDQMIVGFVSFPSTRQRNRRDRLECRSSRSLRNGIGTTLYTFAIDQMRRAGMLLATVGVGGDPSHIQAQRAYRTGRIWARHTKHLDVQSSFSGDRSRLKPAGPSASERSCATIAPALRNILQSAGSFGPIRYIEKLARPAMTMTKEDAHD